MSHFVWDTLGIDPTLDVRSIKRAYAQRLKQKRPEDDAEAFQRLRHAYEWALHWAEQEREEADEQTPQPVSASADVGTQSAELVTNPITVTVDAISGNILTTNTSAENNKSAPNSPTLNRNAKPEFTQFDSKVPEILEGIRAALSQTERDATRLFSSQNLQALSFAERELLELGLLALIAQQHSFPLDFACSVAEAFNWRDRDVQQALYRQQPEQTGYTLSRLAAEWQREQLMSKLVLDPLSLEAWTLLNGNASRWEIWKARVNPALMQRLIDVMYLTQHDAPNLWRKLQDNESIQYWQQHARKPRLGHNAYLTAVIAALVVFFSLLRSQGMVVSLLCFAGTFTGWCGVTYGLQTLDERLRESHARRLQWVTATLILHLLALPVLLRYPDYAIPALLSCVALWPLILVLTAWWPQPLAPFFANKWLGVLVLVWVGGLVVSSGDGEQGRLLPAALLVMNVFLLMRTLKDVLAETENALLEKFPKMMMGLAVFILVVGLAQLLLWPDNIMLAFVLFSTVVMFASAWRPPELNVLRHWRIAILICTVLLVPKLIALLPPVNTVSRYTLQSLVMMLVVTGALHAVARLKITWQRSRQ